MYLASKREPCFIVLILCVDKTAMQRAVLSCVHTVTTCVGNISTAVAEPGCSRLEDPGPSIQRDTDVEPLIGVKGLPSSQNGSLGRTPQKVNRFGYPIANVASNFAENLDISCTFGAGGSSSPTKGGYCQVRRLCPASATAQQAAELISMRGYASKMSI